MKIRGAIFDMDGTLIDSLVFWNILWNKLGKKYLNDESFYPTAAQDRATRTMTTENATNYIYNIYKFGESSKALYEEVNNYIIDFYMNDVKIKKGTIEFLKYLKNIGIKMCVASATDKPFIEKVLQKFCLEKYFDGVFSCADIGIGKDKPDIYFIAADFLKMKPTDICVFEDSATAVVTAKTANFRTVGIYDENNYGQDILKANSDIYINKKENIDKLIGLFCKKS